MADILIVCLGCIALFALAVRAIVRACFCELVDGVTAGAAWVWGSSFVVQVLGCMLLLRAGLSAIAAGFAVVVLALSAAGIPLVCGRLSERELVRQAHGADIAFESSGIERDQRIASDRGSEKAVAIRCAWVARAYDLTRREEDVLCLLVRGMTVPQIADGLVLSPNTVKSHVRNLYRKLGVSSRSGLAARMAEVDGDTAAWGLGRECDERSCFLVAQAGAESVSARSE